MTLQGGTVLGRLIQRADAAPVEEQCELCGTPLPDTHRHVLDLHADAVRCACQACGLLFEREAAARGHYRLVPRRRLRLRADEAPDTGVPVGLAFFTVRPDGSVTARYPSPLGSTSWDCDEAIWAALRGRWPQLADLAPAVEALLVNTARGRSDYWIVPIDDCYRLVAVVRTHWKGLSGGREVWPAVDEFFAELKEAS
jgi:hypothetical protein